MKSDEVTQKQASEGRQVLNGFKISIVITMSLAVYAITAFVARLILYDFQYPSDQDVIGLFNMLVEAVLLLALIINVVLAIVTISFSKHKYKYNIIVLKFCIFFSIAEAVGVIWLFFLR